MTDDERLIERIRRLREHGQRRKYLHAGAGWNARVDGLPAAAFSVKLEHPNGWNQSRLPSQLDNLEAILP